MHLELNYEKRRVVMVKYFVKNCLNKNKKEKVNHQSPQNLSAFS